MRALALILALLAPADGEQDNQPDNVRRIPPPGVKVPDADRAELEAGVKRLEEALGGIEGKNPILYADVDVYRKALDWALRYDEIFDLKEIPAAKRLLQTGLERAAALKEGKAPWASATGNLPRGYYSKIDGSVQPYGLVVPASYAPGSGKKYRLDTWFHGRGEKLSELSFIDQRSKSAGEFAPADTFVLHLYGRYCNANKMAGEIDLFEALDVVKEQYPIDDDRIVIRGFSMGGAACWQFAVHYPSLWAAAAPGAGFSETPDFLKVFQNEKIAPTEYEKTLWHWYDCTDWAANLFNLPVVAYSGEKDRQKQAADIMAKAMKEEGLDLVHIIGPNTEHKYEPEAKKEINRRIDELAVKGRDRFPAKIRFTTWTLRYNRMHWVRVDGLERHWARGRVEAERTPEGVVVKTSGITGLTLELPPFDGKVTIDGQAFGTGGSFRKSEGAWAPLGKTGHPPLAKRHGLQGPIDDAFMDSFVMVRPGGKAKNAQVQAWVEKEMKHAVDHWRRQFRGDARQVPDTEVTDEMIKSSNLVLWGDEQSNAVLAKIAARLPLKNLPLTAETQVPLLIYPNPLNPDRYVVLNSGFTFREYDYLNNARQVAKLPDWAVVDVTTPPNSRWPGKVVAADFFDEAWQVKK